jgi:hypothetical protein
MRLLGLVLMLVAAPLLAQEVPAVKSVPLPGASSSAAPVQGAAPAPVATTAPTTTPPPAPATAAASAAAPAKPQGQTFSQDDVLGAAEGVFGKGAEGLAEAIAKSFKQYGEPNAYIAGTEAGGAFIVGLRYGSGELHHKVEGTMPIHWTGPSLGIDVGGDGSKVFTLVYNLYDTADIFHRYAAVSGLAYFVGGLSVNYLKRDDVVVVPIKLGVGVRLGVNAGYMKFTRKADFIPF